METLTNDFKATELASHEYIRNLPQSEKIKLAQLLQEETAIATPVAITPAALTDMLGHAQDCKDYLSECEAVLNLVMESLDSGDSDDETKRLAIKTALGKITEVYNCLDVCFCFTLDRALSAQ